MSSPNADPFSTATSCSVCLADQQGTNTDNDETTCCGAVPVTAGTCTACASALASGCTAVTCDFGFDNIDDDATNGCEVLCAPVPNGTCSACTSPVASGCTAVSCNVGYSSLDDDATNGCEVLCAPLTGGVCTACTSTLTGACTALKCVAGRTSRDNNVNNGCEVEKLPNGDGSNSATGNPNTLRKAVSDWIAAEGASSSTVYITYGPIEEWDVSDVTNMAWVFYNFGSFNADLSKWDTGKVTDMTGSK
jgi:surface protein